MRRGLKRRIASLLLDCDFDVHEVRHQPQSPVRLALHPFSLRVGLGGDVRQVRHRPQAPVRLVSRNFPSALAWVGTCVPSPRIWDARRLAIPFLTKRALILIRSVLPQANKKALAERARAFWKGNQLPAYSRSPKATTGMKIQGKRSIPIPKKKPRPNIRAKRKGAINARIRLTPGMR